MLHEKIYLITDCVIIKLIRKIKTLIQKKKVRYLLAMAITYKECSMRLIVLLV